MRLRLSRDIFIALLLHVMAAHPALAQTIAGKVTDRESGESITGAVVQLLDLRGGIQSRSLTDGSGSYALTAPSAGRFSLRVDRIGFLSEFSAPVDLASGEEKLYPIVVRSRTSTLEGITVQGRSRGCSIRENGETITRVWEEARKALDAISLSQAAALVRFNTETFRRELDPMTGTVLVEERRSTFDQAGNPFRSVPAAELAERGYVRTFPDSIIYYAPDAWVLLSDIFLDTHCFRLASGRAGDAELLGLEFRPAGRVSRPEVEGTLWLDRKTSALRALDYRYVGHALAAAADRLGGRIEFERVLPSGVWIVRRWVIRMPVVTQRKTRFVNPATYRSEEHTETRMTRMVEEGGEVVSFFAPGGTRQSSSERAAVSGIVVDSLTGKPLAGAVVYLSGTSLSDTTDSFGRYLIANVPEATYVVSFMHPKLREHGITASQQRGEVRPPAQLRVDLAVPSLSTVIRRHCPGLTGEDAGVLVGYVKDERTGEPLPNAQIRVDWKTASGIRAGSLPRRVGPTGDVKASPADAWVEVNATEAEVATDVAGFFRICGVPNDSSAEIEVRSGRNVVRRSIRLDSDRLTFQEITIALK